MKENIIAFVKKNKKILTVIGVLILVGIIWYVWSKSSSSKSDGSAESLAKCLKRKGAKFYGASWCGHCKAQKQMFGDAAKYLPYIECSIGGTKNQKQECTDAGVKGYPMWVFPGGKTQSGEMTLDQLRQAVGC